MRSAAVAVMAVVLLLAVWPATALTPDDAAQKCEDVRTAAIARRESNAPLFIVFRIF